MGFDPQGCQGRGTWITFKGGLDLAQDSWEVGVAGDSVWFGHPARTGYYAWLTQRSLPWQNYEPGTSTGSRPVALTRGP